MGKYLGSTGLTYLWGKIKAALGVKEDKATIVNHGTSNTTFALTPNVLHVWGTINSLTLSLVTDTDNYVDGYWFKFTASSSFTALTMPSGVVWAAEPEIEAGKTYEVFIVNDLATYITEGIEAMYATKQWVQSNIKTINGNSLIGTGNIIINDGSGDAAEVPVVNHGTSDTTLSILPNVFHVWGEVTSLSLTLTAGSSSVVNEYMFQFTSGSTPTSLSFSSNVSWITDSTIEANKTYQVSVLNNLVVMGGA